MREAPLRGLLGREGAYPVLSRGVEKNTSILISERQREALAALARREGKGVCEPIRDALDRFLELAPKAEGSLGLRGIRAIARDPDHARVSRALEARAFFRRRRDKGYSFTDCSSFAVMRRLKIPTAISTDIHFQRAGFEVEP